MINNLVSRRSESPVPGATGSGRVIPARVRPQTSQTYYHRNQQYSIVGLTNAAGTLVERYTYSAYGTLGIYAANGTVRSSSTYANRYTYTGREWDADLRLYHFRARWYDPASGGFISRDPLGYVDGLSLYRGYFGVRGLDPSGKAVHCVMIGFEFYFVMGGGLNWGFHCYDECGNTAQVIMPRAGLGIGSAVDGGIVYIPGYDCISDIPLDGPPRKNQTGYEGEWDFTFPVPKTCLGGSGGLGGSVSGTAGIGGSVTVGMTWVRATSKKIVAPCPCKCEPTQPAFPREPKPCFEGSTIGPLDPGHQCGIICSGFEHIGSPAWQDCVDECAEQYDKSGIPPFDDPYWRHR